MCLLSITENGEVSVCSGQGRLDRGPSSLGAELTLLLPTGLIPKDYRSLKTQYLQSYGPEHLLTFHNLKRIGLLTEQSAAETLTAVESRVSKLVTDRAAAESQPSAPGELGAQPCPAGSCCSRAGWKHAAKVDTAGTELRAGQSFGPWEQQGWQVLLLVLFWSPELCASLCPAVTNPEALSCFFSSCFPGKITDAFNSLARKSNFPARSKKLGLVCPCGAAALPTCPLVPEQLWSLCAGWAPSETHTAQGQSCCGSGVAEGDEGAEGFKNGRDVPEW
ncbi:uncharacterized protein LOC128850888 isoform X2 [Cuculus canorus]|uniref:uncharacterized protein LOC128850888 isoform X2 n=1 Tax=Cuculus canorus TaxID=55661 RepID=UPI0023AA92C5|nr:uncharacterized protein LOC128850888 isoform X2 [Cuculus canorus]